MQRRTKTGCFFAAFFAIILFFSGVMSFWIVSIATPEDSPRARMFRTEADLRALKTAIETYHNEYGAYPPGGPKGLQKAINFLSRHVNYLPDGGPGDAWGNPFHYVPASQYDLPDSGALRGDHGWYAPDTYQLYSPGMDGYPGFEETLKQRDNITSWDENRSWRDLYSQRQRKYLLEMGRKQ